MKSEALNTKQINGENKKTFADQNTFEFELSKNELSIEKLKTYKGFENISDEQAEKEIEIIKSFIQILYGIYVKENKLTDNNKE